MLHEKRKILIHRLIWLSFFILGIVIPAILHFNYIIDVRWYLVYFFILDVFLLGMFICTLLLSCKEYKYDGYSIVVYSGFYHHYIKINGRIEDEHNTIATFSAIYLSCTIDEQYFEATISLTNRISLKINDRLYKNK